MEPQTESSAVPDDFTAVERRITERTKRVSTLLDLDSVLCSAANRYSLAADMVHYGLPPRAD